MHAGTAVSLRLHAMFSAIHGCTYLDRDPCIVHGKRVWRNVIKPNKLIIRDQQEKTMLQLCAILQAHLSRASAKGIVSIYMDLAGSDGATSLNLRCDTVSGATRSGCGGTTLVPALPILSGCRLLQRKMS